jgi:hypothetical protein
MKDFGELEEVLKVNPLALNRKGLLDHLDTINNLPLETTVTINKLFKQYPEKNSN